MSQRPPQPTASLGSISSPSTLRADAVTQLSRSDTPTPHPACARRAFKNSPNGLAKRTRETNSRNELANRTRETNSPNQQPKPTAPSVNAPAHLRRLPPYGLEDALIGRGRRAPRMSLGRASTAPRGEVAARSALSERVGPSSPGPRHALRLSTPSATLQRPAPTSHQPPSPNTRRGARPFAV